MARLDVEVQESVGPDRYTRAGSCHECTDQWGGGGPGDHHAERSAGACEGSDSSQALDFVPPGVARFSRAAPGSPFCLRIFPSLELPLMLLPA